ncbi:MAG: PD-(D/E)XK nuclease family protein [Patescibacteria group bacterium]|nr:PD-(D/E)XK nuclease family protein [Patescibacteria group bacterium]
MIQYTKLNHPWPYHYYIEQNNQELDKFSNLKSFLESMRSECPHEKFLEGPRSSSLKISSGVKLIEIPKHELCSLAKQGNDWGMQGSAHGNVQLWMMKNDPKTVSVEVPLWFDEKELKEYGFSFEKKGSLSGHIDILRIENNKIWVWDYKPKAAKEKYADTQVFMYTLMLSHRTGIPLENFMCGYFDEKTSFIFKPEEEQLNNLKQLI